MRILKTMAVAAMISALAGSATAATTLYKFDVTITDPGGSGFSFPLIEYFNLSDPGVTVTKARVFNGPPWDWVFNGPGPSAISNPAGGTRTLLEGEERGNDGNNGCTPGITYGFTSFDTGDSFRFAADPETGGCGSAVVDTRPFLNNDTLMVTMDFSGGVSLTGNDWVLEYINPNANHSDAANQLYRLTMQTTVTTVDPPGVPEPATWAMMILGFGGAGAMLRRRAGRSARA